MYADMDARLAALEQRLGVTFKNRALLLEAVTHRSYLNESRRHPVRHNELLEFLGDAVLEIAVTEYLFKRFRGKKTEGDLTNWRAALVNARTCAMLAEKLGVEGCLLMSRGEFKDKASKARMHILADAFEAILGAVHQDQGIGAARFVVDALVLAHFSKIIENAIDAKTTFQEVAQARWGITPHYETLREWGPDHARNFHVGVFLQRKMVAQAEGMTKKEAHEAAAKIALQTINAREGRLEERG